jgi:hypothetical protein
MKMNEIEIPVVKQWVILREPEIKRRNTLDAATYIYIFFNSLTKHKYFGETEKEKNEFYNDISIFETACFVLSKITYYIEEKYPERLLLSSYRRFYTERVLKQKVELCNDILELIIYTFNLIYTKKLNWSNAKQLIYNRIKFWRTYSNSPHFYYSLFMSTITKSNTIDFPIENLSDKPFQLNQGFIDNINRIIDIKSFENAMLPIFYEHLNDFFKANISFGYEINSKWK